MSDRDTSLDYLANIMAEGLSSEMSAAVDIPSEDESADSIQGNAILQQFNQVNTQIADTVLNRAEGAILRKLETDEEYIRLIAARLYTEIYTQARKYLKNWCSANNMSQKWSNPFLTEFKAKYLKASSPFIPQVYSVSIVNNDTKESKTLVHYAKTSREATINAAKALGFEDSIERKLGFNKFAQSTIQILLEEPKFLKEQEALHEFEELRRQIEARKYVPSYIRDRWKSELEDKQLKKNGVI